MHCPFYFNISSSFLSSSSTFYHAVFSGGWGRLDPVAAETGLKCQLSFFLPFILIVYTLIIFLFILFDCIGPG